MKKKHVFSALGIFVLVGVAYYAYWEKALYRFTAVTEHQLYQSAEIPADEVLAVAKSHRIRTVIDFRLTEESPDDIAAEQAALAGSDVTYVHLPATHVPDEATVMNFLQVVGDPANRPVLIHCKHGTGRSVLFASLFRVEFEHWDNDVARRAVEPLHWRGNFAPDAPKGKYLLSYKPHKMLLTVTANQSVQ